jgi:hypothetical protein
MESLQEKIVKDNLYKLMTNKETSDFFSEIWVQLINKKKLYDDIRKLSSKDECLSI